MIRKKQKIKKPIDYILEKRKGKNCLFCSEFYDPMVGRKWRCEFLTKFSYINGPRYEPIPFDKPCFHPDYDICPLRTLWRWKKDS
jgi:hypothetical protein